MILRYQYPASSFPVFFEAEIVSLDRWYQPLEEPIPPPEIHVSAIPFSFLTEFSTNPPGVLGWYVPLATPIPPRRIHPSEIPYYALVEYTSQPKSVLEWYQPLAEPLQPARMLVAEMPFLFYSYLPPVFGCIEAEVTQYYIPRLTPQPNMPILYITQWNRYATAPPICMTTQQSPGSQPEFGS